MKSFFKTFFACLLALIVSSALLFIISISALSILALSSNNTKESLKSGTPLLIELSEVIVDDDVKDPISNINLLSLSVDKKLSMLNIVNAIEYASIDRNISGIVLQLPTYLMIDMANAKEIRDALIEFKKSGKKIIASAEYMTQISYYICSAADKVILQPCGELEWMGLSAQVMFYKGLLDKLQVEPEIIRHGKFKSAVEPFIQEKMSPESREQSLEMINSMWEVLVEDISASRAIPQASLQQYASTLAVTNAEKAVELGMVDELRYSWELESVVEEFLGSSQKPIKLSSYIRNIGDIYKYSQNKVAVIYAEGEIVSEPLGGTGYLVSGDFIKQVKRAAGDNNVKAVVIRVNSPGGSAMAADDMWSSVKMLRDKKPVIASFGNIAASGGYYLAAPADAIIAEPTTITGSIGVFGILVNAEKGLKNKLGITTDVVNSNQYADIRSPFRALESREREFIQNQVDDIYHNFVSIVAQGRNLTYEEVDAVAGGRVWSGVDALEHGLIDGFGGLNSAIATAADRAGVGTDYRVEIISTDKSEFDIILQQMLMEVKAAVMPASTAAVSEQQEQLMRMLSGDKIQAITRPITIK